MALPRRVKSHLGLIRSPPAFDLDDLRLDSHLGVVPSRLRAASDSLSIPLTTPVRKGRLSGLRVREAQHRGELDLVAEGLSKPLYSPS